MKKRLDIINKTKYPESITDIFSFLNNSDINKVPDYLSYHGLQYAETDKFGIIFTPKSGSSLINSLCKVNNLTENSNQKNIAIDLQQTQNLFGIFENDDKQFDGLRNMLIGKSKKDLIIVTRNPVSKLLSGTIQELYMEYSNSKSLSEWVSEKYNIEFKDIKSFLKTKLYSFEKKQEILSDITYKYLYSVYRKTGRTTQGHSQLYNEMVYTILGNHDKINLSKLRIIDIDSSTGNIVSLFKEYYPELKGNELIEEFNTHRTDWDLFFGKLLKKFYELSDPFWVAMKTDVSRQYYYYTLTLEKYKNNLYKGPLI